MPVGVDTSFFFAIERKHPVALSLWSNEAIITSSISIFELQRKLLTGEFNGHHLLSQIERSVEIVSVSLSIAKKAARISHTFGIPSLDSLILSSLVEVGCKRIYSTDPHFDQFKEKSIKIIRLKKS
ncbi:MAG: PIN domain-containing protein [Nitrospirota bacterium]